MFVCCLLNLFVCLLYIDILCLGVDDGQTINWRRRDSVGLWDGSTYRMRAKDDSGLWWIKYQLRAKYTSWGWDGQPRLLRVDGGSTINREPKIPRRIDVCVRSHYLYALYVYCDMWYFGKLTKLYAYGYRFSVFQVVLQILGGR